MGFLEDMAGHDEEFKQAEPSASTAIFSNGKHQAIITICRLEEGTYGWQLVLGLRGTDESTKAPASIRSWYDLPPESGSWKEEKLAGDLLSLGYNYKEEGLSGLQAWCESEAAMHVLCTIGVTRKAGETRDYVNMYLNGVHGKVEESQVERYTGGVVESDGGSADGADFASEEVDDIPF